MLYTYHDGWQFYKSEIPPWQHPMTKDDYTAPEETELSDETAITQLRDTDSS
jgi:hypothetical protein